MISSTQSRAKQSEADYRIRGRINECKNDGQQNDAVKHGEQHEQCKCLEECTIAVRLCSAEWSSSKYSNDGTVDQRTTNCSQHCSRSHITLAYVRNIVRRKDEMKWTGTNQRKSGARVPHNRRTALQKERLHGKLCKVVTRDSDRADDGHRSEDVVRESNEIDETDELQIDDQHDQYDTECRPEICQQHN